MEMNKAAVILLEELELKGFIIIENSNLITKFKLSKDTYKGKMIINVYNNRATAILKKDKGRIKVSFTKYSRKECVNYFLKRIDLFLNPRLLKSFQGNGLSLLSYEHKNILIVNDIVHEVDLKEIIKLRNYITDKYQYDIPMSLKEIIEQLEKVNPESILILLNPYNGMKNIGLGFGSYRGRYDNLYFEPERGKEVKVKDFLKELKGDIGITVEGYKGGEYEIVEDSNLYVSEPGVASGMVITGIKVGDSYTYLINEFLG